ncbi:MAG: hypothetical protein LC793_07575 [Thermomicrobia bacterium]|nr:hypothetical protein [Thermomicrobia bacterium]
MPDRPINSKKTAIQIALGAALGGALGLTAALRNKRAIESGQSVADDGQQPVGAPLVGALPERAPTRGAPTTSGASSDHPDWETLPAAHLPRPTYWPVVLAVGILFLAWGIVTTIAISVIGLLLLALALGGWIGELRHGH